MGKSSSSLQQGRQDIRTFFIFDNTAPISAPLRKFTSIRITIGSGLKRVAKGSVSTRYQTSLFAQPLKTLLESILGVNIQQQLNPLSSRPIFEETSVDSC